MDKEILKAALHRALNLVDNEIADYRQKFINAKDSTTRHQARYKIQMLERQRDEFMKIWNELKKPG